MATEIKIKNEDDLDKVISSIAIKITGEEDNIYFNKQDVVQVLNDISKELGDQKQLEGFLFARDFILKMGQ